MDNSGIIPRGHRILILPNQIESVSKGGIILGTATELDRAQLGQTDGIVVSLGNTAYEDLSEPWCAVGDKVVIAKYSGMMRQGLDEQWYRIISDTDVVAILEKDISNE